MNFTEASNYQPDIRRLSDKLQALVEELTRLRARLARIDSFGWRDDDQLEAAKHAHDTLVSLGWHWAGAQYWIPPSSAATDADAQSLRDLLARVPLPPKAITFEKGWELLDLLQVLARDRYQ